MYLASIDLASIAFMASIGAFMAGFALWGITLMVRQECETMQGRQGE